MANDPKTDAMSGETGDHSAGQVRLPGAEVKGKAAGESQAPPAQGAAPVFSDQAFSDAFAGVDASALAPKATSRVTFSGVGIPAEPIQVKEAAPVEADAPPPPIGGNTLIGQRDDPLASPQPFTHVGVPPGPSAGTSNESTVTPIPTGWLGPQDDASSQIVHQYADRQRRFVAATSSGVTSPLLPQGMAGASRAPEISDVGPTIPQSNEFYEGRIDHVPTGTKAKRAKAGQKPRTKVGRAILKNRAEIALLAESFLRLIDDKLAALRAELPNSDDATTARDRAITHYEELIPLP